MSTLTAPALAIGDEVRIRDARQTDAPFSPTMAHGSWYVLDIRGVAATIGRSRTALFAMHTPVSNLRRIGPGPAAPASLPLAASVYAGDKRTWYPARPEWIGPLRPGDVMWFPAPEIPIGLPFRWATLAEADVAGLDLESSSTLALLLYQSELEPDHGWPITPEMLHACVLAQADRFNCCLDCVFIALAHDMAGRQGECEARMAWCEELAKTVAVSR